MASHNINLLLNGEWPSVPPLRSQASFILGLLSPKTVGSSAGFFYLIKRESIADCTRGDYGSGWHTSLLPTFHCPELGHKVILNCWGSWGTWTSFVPRRWQNCIPVNTFRAFQCVWGQRDCHPFYYSKDRIQCTVGAKGRRGWPQLE